MKKFFTQVSEKARRIIFIKMSEQIRIHLNPKKHQDYYEINFDELTNDVVVSTINSLDTEYNQDKLEEFRYLNTHHREEIREYVIDKIYRDRFIDKKDQQAFHQWMTYNYNYNKKIKIKELLKENGLELKNKSIDELQYPEIKEIVWYIFTGDERENTFEKYLTFETKREVVR